MKTNYGTETHSVNADRTYSKKKGYFREALRVAGSFGRAKKFGNPDFAKEAVSRFEKLKEKVHKDDDPFAYATELSINVEAYVATGKGRYARQARRDADALAVLDVAKPSETEDKLMAASALLKYYELSKEKVYRKKAEELFGGIEVKCSNKFQKKLACMAYSDADRIVGGFESEKELFESEAKSIEKDKLGTYLYISQKLVDKLYYPVAKKAVYGIGGLADKAGDYLEEKGWEKTGHAVKFIFGTETLKRTSFRAGPSLVLSIPGLPLVGNISGGCTWWVPDINYLEQNGGELSDYHRYAYGEINFPWISKGITTFGPSTAITAIPWTSFYVDPRMEYVRIGVPNWLAFYFGKIGTNGPGQYAQGPILGFDIGAGILAFSAFGYSPIFEPVVNWLHPKADWLRSKNDAVLNYAKELAKRRYKTGDAARSYTGKEIYGTFPFTRG